MSMQQTHLTPEVTSRQVRDRLAATVRSYESVTRRLLPTQCFTVIRVDGKAFASYTAGLHKPFDEVFADDMDETALTLAEQTQGAVAVYVVSDEISLVLTDMTSANAQPAFGGVEAKLVSLTAALATVRFNRHRDLQHPGLFDARVFTLPDENAVREYLAYRQSDGIRNAVSMLARHSYGPEGIKGVGVRTLLTRMEEDGHVLDDRHSLGRLGVRVQESRTVTYTHKRTGERNTVDTISNGFRLSPAPVFLHAELELLPERNSRDLPKVG